MKKIKLLLVLVFVISLFSTSLLHVEAVNKIQAESCFKFTQNLAQYDGLRNNKKDVVLELQESLFRAGYLTIKPSGYFGVSTTQAIKKYQKDNNLPQTGYVGQKTRKALRAQFCADEPYPICDYAAPPEGCSYVAGPDYNSQTQCGMVLSCINNESGISPNCKVWNDGCNTCSKTSTKGPEMCTMRACRQESLVKPYCIEYFETGLRSCPSEKIINKTPIVCVKAPCDVSNTDYYIYNGARKEISDFDQNWVQNNCSIKETIVY